MSRPVLALPCVRLVALAALVAGAGGCSDRAEARYATFADAERAGAVQRGWIPGWIPATATDLVEVHDLDTNAQVIRFRAPPDALAVMAEHLTPAPKESVPSPRAHLRAPWGEALRDVMNSYAGAARGELAYYRARTPSGPERWVAVDTRASVVYAWTRGD